MVADGPLRCINFTLHNVDHSLLLCTSASLHGLCLVKQVMSRTCVVGYSALSKWRKEKKLENVHVAVRLKLFYWVICSLDCTENSTRGYSRVFVKEEAWKKSGLQRDSNPRPPRYYIYTSQHFTPHGLPNWAWSDERLLFLVLLFNIWPSAFGRVVNNTHFH